MKDRVLITGGSGFIGTTFCEVVRHRFDLVAVDRVPPRERFDGVHYGYCDITNAGDVNRVIAELEPDHIIHLAARARVEDGIRDPAGTNRVNVDGPINVLEAAHRSANLKTAVLASSETVYGAVETYPTPEELGPGKPNSVYAASKAAADLVWQRFPMPKGSRAIVARSAMGAGPRSSPQEQVTSRFVQNVLRGKPLLFPGRTPRAGEAPVESAWRMEAGYGRGVRCRGHPDTQVQHPTRDISAALNFVHGVSLILENPDAMGPVYNIGSGAEVSMLDLARCVVKTLVVSVGVEQSVPEPEIFFDPAFKYRAGEEGYRTALSIEKARKELGYEPVITLEQAVRCTAHWMEANPTYWQERRVQASEAWAPYSGAVKLGPAAAARAGVVA